jgi:hypothetical protein
MNSVNLGTITIPIIKGEKGDKPVKGVDYWTEADKEEIVNDVETTYNANHEAKMQEYNDNASDKIDDFDGHVSDKTDDFDSHVTSKISEFDTNALNKTTTFNNNATSKTTDFNTNATNKTTTFNDNVTSKTTQFNELVEDKEDEIEAINNTLTPRVEALESGMSNYYKKTETYSKTEIDNKVSSVYRYKGTVSTYADLPVSDLTVGDVYNVETTDSTHGIKAGDNVSWNGTVWDVLAGTVDLSGYQTKIDNSHKLASDLVDDTNQTNKFTTTQEKSGWSAKYNKPSGGIPKTDLASDVQASLGKADTAVQDVSGKEDTSNKTNTIDSNSTNTQYAGAKAVYDYVSSVVGDISDLLDELNGTEV